MNIKLKQTSNLIFIILLLSFSFSSTSHASNSHKSSLSNSIDIVEIDPEIDTNPVLIYLEDYINTEINAELDDFEISGVTVSVVDVDDMIFAEGYGYKDFGNSTPVAPDETLFRIGSISKTFTAVATMQLVELGILDLDTDVNTYLSAFEIPDTFSEPITLRHLLTHTAGFEVSTSKVVYESSEEMLSLEDDLITNMPDRVRPPGEYTAYSNYGVSLVGYIIQEMSGTTFYEYIEQSITLPLGMNHTTCRQQLPANLQDSMSSAYLDADHPGYYEYFSLYPAGGFTSTATDMAKFMLMLLNNGTFNNATILEENSVQEMFSDQYSVHPGIPSVGLGIYENNYKNVHVIGHGGDTIFFHSYMMLFPEEGFGIFISYNSRTGIYGISRFINGFFENFYSFSRIVEPIENYKQHSKLFTGMYVSTRRYYNEKNGIKILYWSEFYSLNITQSRGFLQIGGLEGIEFVEVDSNYFVEKTGEYDLSLFFITDSDGSVTHLFTNWDTALITYEKVHSSYINLNLQIGILMFIGTVSLISFSIWGVDAIFNLKKSREKAKIMPLFAKIWNLGFLISAIVTVTLIMSKNHETIVLSTESAATFQNLMFLPSISLVFSIVGIVFTFFAWFGIATIDKKPYWSLIARIQYSILTLFSILYLIFPIYWEIFLF